MIRFKISYGRPDTSRPGVYWAGLVFELAPDEATALEQFKKRVPTASVTAICVVPKEQP